MPQYNAPGGGVIDSGDKRIQRKVVVSTSGNPTAPGGNGRLTNVTVTEEPGGIRRGIYEYTVGGLGDASYNIYGKKIELMGGSREVSIFNHEDFANLTAQQITDVQKAVDEKKLLGLGYPESATKLYGFLLRKIEYYLAPSLVARVSEIESNIPSTDGLCKVQNPSEVNAPEGTFWILSGISATPVGDKYEVTREYTSVPADWADIAILYN
jgi:hypothetical protein